MLFVFAIYETLDLVKKDLNYNVNTADVLPVSAYQTKCTLNFSKQPDSPVDDIAFQDVELITKEIWPKI